MGTRGTGNRGITTFGEVVVDHDVTIRNEAEEVENMARLISGHLRNGPEKNYEAERFVVAQFNYYCADSTLNPKYLLPSEFSLRTFSLEEGLARSLACNVNGLIDPIICPRGMRCESMETAQQCKIPMIGKSQADIAKLVEEAAAKGSSSPAASIKIYSPTEAFRAIERVIGWASPMITDQRWVFVMRDHISVADRCLKYLKLRATEGQSDQHGFKLVPLTMLALELKKLCPHKTYSIPNITNEGHAERILEHPQYAYNREIACDWHAMRENEDAVDKCSHNAVTRMLFNLLGYLRATQSLPVYPPKFAPRLEHIDVVDREAMAKLAQEEARKHR